MDDEYDEGVDRDGDDEGLAGENAEMMAIQLDIGDFDPARSARCDYSDDRVSSEELHNLQRLVETAPTCVREFIHRAEAQVADSKTADFYEGQLSAFTQVMALVRSVSDKTPVMAGGMSFVSALILSQAAPVVRRVRARRQAKEKTNAGKTDSS